MKFIKDPNRIYTISKAGVSAKQASNAINRFIKRLTPYFKDGD